MRVGVFACENLSLPMSVMTLDLFLVVVNVNFCFNSFAELSLEINRIYFITVFLSCWPGQLSTGIETVVVDLNLSLFISKTPTFATINSFLNNKTNHLLFNVSSRP